MNTEDKQNKKVEGKKKLESGCGDIVDDFIEDVWSVMTPQMIDRLKCILKDDMGLSKQDVDKFIESQREIRRQRICLKNTQRSVRIGPRNQWIKEVSRSIGDQMAVVIVGILSSNRTARSKRVTEKVLERLCELTGEDTTVESAKTRIERTLVVIADRMATWIDEALSDIEEKFQEKYISPESLESLLSETYSTSTISSEFSSKKSGTLYSSEPEIESTMSTVTIESEEKYEKVRDDKHMEVEKGTSGEEEEKETRLTIEEISSGERSAEESTEKETEEEGEEEEEEEQEETELEEEESEKEIVSEEVEEEAEEESEKEDEEADEEDVSEEDSGDLEDVEEEEMEEEETENDDLEEENEGRDDKEEKEAVSILSKVSGESIERLEGSGTELLSGDSRENDKKKLQGDILDLLKEDIARISREEEETDRQMSVKEIIDKRLEKIAKEKLDQSLDSLIKYDIDEAASTVANWVEKILASAERSPMVSSGYQSQGPAFEIKRGSGSQFQVFKVSSTSVAQKVANARGVDLPLRKNKLPRTMSPMGLKSGKDWADWALGAANVGEEWGKWLDSTISDVEEKLLIDRSEKTHKEKYDEWREWRDRRALEAQKWRVEKQKIKDEGMLWNRKLKGNPKKKPEQQTLVHIY